MNSKEQITALDNKGLWKPEVAMRIGLFLYESLGKVKGEKALIDLISQEYEYYFNK